MTDKWDTLHHSTEQGTNDWRTPRSFFEKLHAEFRFEVDAAASSTNAMLPFYWTVEDDALAQDWATVGGAVWCNPPYGRVIGKWLAKAVQERDHGVTTVLLTFARTDTAWWHDYAMQANVIVFVRGRLSFERPDGTKGDPAPAPSVLLVYYGDCGGRPLPELVTSMEAK
jgi:phage N-6-adenine-methyltransferase